MFSTAKIHKILVVRTDRMGDVLLNIPAIRALKQSFGSSLTVLANPALRELLLGIPEIDRVLPFEEEKWNKSLLARMNLLRQIRGMKFDLAVVLNPARRFHILAYLAGIPRRLGYDRKWGFLLTDKIEDRKFLGQKHEVEYNLDLVRSIGADTDDLDISLKVEPEDKAFVKDLLWKYAVRDTDLLIAIHPHSSNPAKCWPGKNFASVADKLCTRFSAKVAIIGGPEERAAAIRLISLTTHSAINLCGQLTLKQLAAFLQRSALLISNDSGPVHIAAAVDAPCVVIFGGNISGVGPKRWGPWGEGHIVLHKQRLASITTEEVIEAAAKQLKQ